MIRPTFHSGVAGSKSRHPAHIDHNQPHVPTAGGLSPADEILQPHRYFDSKYAVERMMALLLLLPALPVMLILGCLVRLTSRGPALYRQRRVGLNGRNFDMFKIRTMRIDAEAATGPQWCTENDPRITPLGRWLRLLHLDELPQLYNVVLGEMTIIGPRPERPDFVKILGEQVQNYNDRLLVKPGITGLAQIYLPPDETIDCVRRKVCFDRAYIETATPLVDLQIWLCTIVRILGLRQGRGPRWFGLDRRYNNAIRICMNAGVAESRQSTNSVPRPRIVKTAVAEPVAGHKLHDSSGIVLDDFPDNPIQTHSPRQPR